MTINSSTTPADPESAFDVVIVGAGYVGCTAALVLDQLGISVCLLSAHPLATQPSAQWDVRVFTLSPGSECLLTGLGVWGCLEAARLAPVYRMAIEADTGIGQLDFDAMTSGVSHLATVVEGGRLQAALESVLRSRTSIVLRAPMTVSDMEWRRDDVVVTLQGGDKLSARLLLGADGTDSMVRARAGIGLHHRGYGQKGVVANFRAEVAHGGRAFQWFRDDGVLAYLPLTERDLSIVWSTDTDRAARLLSLPANLLAEEVAAAGGKVLGELVPLSAAAAFPLRLARAERVTGHRLVLLGDAAHSVHPLAGQGVNLGLRDVAALAKLLKERQPGTDVASAATLKQYEIARRRDTMSMMALTDGLQRLFGVQHPMARAVRSNGMTFLDRIPVIKRALMRQAML